MLFFNNITSFRKSVIALQRIHEYIYCQVQTLFLCVHYKILHKKLQFQCLQLSVSTFDILYDNQGNDNFRRLEIIRVVNCYFKYVNRSVSISMLLTPICIMYFHIVTNTFCSFFSNNKIHVQHTTRICLSFLKNRFFL